jgi:uncharacterized protein YijF (DUF1287 family)
MLYRVAVFALLLALPAAAQDHGSCLVDAAREQIGVTVRYDSAYRSIPYPNGDVPMDRGVCTDVLIRAYRRLGIDLQFLVHEDMRSSWAAYPKLWGLSRPDRNIDHRRVPNLATFFARHGETLPADRRPQTYIAGDLVTWRLPSGVPHIGIVSSRTTPSGTPLVVHNIGRGAVEEDVLFQYTITGRYRYLPESLSGACNGSGGVPVRPRR